MSKRIERIIELQVYKWEHQLSGSAQKSKKRGLQKTLKISKGQG
jgi:hypothetical protein